jgi:hypothetical protein
MLCPNCETEKETKDFRRVATLAQTRAWLRNPNATRRMEYVGSFCNTCSKQHARHSKDLSPGEYRKKLINEGMHPLIIEELVKSRVKQGKAKLKAGAIRALRIQRTPQFIPLIAELRNLSRTLNRRIKNAQTQEMRAFLSTCLAQVLLSLAQLKEMKRTARAAPVCWQKLIKEVDQEDILSKFSRVSESEKVKIADILQTMRVPREYVEKVPYDPSKPLPPPEAYKTYAEYITR